MLPWHNESRGAAAVRFKSFGTTCLEDIVLLGCVDKREGGKGLRQDPIGNVDSSRQLFTFIRREYWCTNGMHWLV